MCCLLLVLQILLNTTLMDYIYRHQGRLKATTSKYKCASRMQKILCVKLINSSNTFKCQTCTLRFATKFEENRAIQSGYFVCSFINPKITHRCKKSTSCAKLKYSLFKCMKNKNTCDVRLCNSCYEPTI